MSSIESARRADNTDPPDERPMPPSPAAQEEVLVRLEGDFGEDGMFGHRTLEVTPTLVRALEPGGAVSFQIPIADVKSARNEPLVGGGRLELTTRTGEVLPVIAYSLTVAAKFSEAARGIEQLANGELLSINLKQ